MWLLKILSGKTQLSAFHSSSVTPPKAPQVDQPAMLTTNSWHLKIRSPTYTRVKLLHGANDILVIMSCFFLMMIYGPGWNVSHIVNYSPTLGVGRSETFTCFCYCVLRSSKVYGSELSIAASSPISFEGMASCEHDAANFCVFFWGG